MRRKVTGIAERRKGPGATRERAKRGINETAGKEGGTTRLVLLFFCFNPLVLIFSFYPSLSFNFKSLFLLFLVHFLKSPSKDTNFLL